MICQYVVWQGAPLRSEGSVHRTYVSHGLVNRRNHGTRAYGRQRSALLYKQFNLFHQQAVHEAFHLYHDLRGNVLTSRAKASDKMIKCIIEWMTEDEGDTEIPHCVSDNISWWYLVDPKKINGAMLQRDNKSLASAIPDLGEQMQKMEQMLLDFLSKVCCGAYSVCTE